MKRGLFFALCVLFSPTESECAPLSPPSLFFGASSGFLFVSTSRPLETSKSGVEGNLRLIASQEFDRWLLDLGAGYQYSQLTAHPEFPATQVKVITRSFVGEISPRWKMDSLGLHGFQIGPVVQALTGGDVSYDEDGSVDELALQVRAGARALYQWGEDFRFRVGASVLSTLNLERRRGIAALLDFQIGFTPVRPAPKEPARTSGVPEFAEVRDRSIRIYLGEALLSFPLGSDRINAKAKEALASLAPVLMKNKDHWSVIRVEGHTDSRDVNHQNQVLSERRAQSVSTELISLGIPEKRTTATGFGAKYPIDQGSTEEAHLLNRRVEIWVDEVDSTQVQTIITELRQMK